MNKVAKTIYLSQVYKAVPLSERICGGEYYLQDGGCGKPILRNAALLDGVLMHFGCLKKRSVQPTHMCNNCGSFLTPKKIVTMNVSGEKIKSCRLCGSSDVTRLGWNRQPNITFQHGRAIRIWPDQSW